MIAAFTNLAYAKNGLLSLCRYAVGTRELETGEIRIFILFSNLYLDFLLRRLEHYDHTTVTKRKKERKKVMNKRKLKELSQMLWHHFVYTHASSEFAASGISPRVDRLRFELRVVCIISHTRLENNNLFSFFYRALWKKSFE